MCQIEWTLLHCWLLLMSIVVYLETPTVYLIQDTVNLGDRGDEPFHLMHVF